MTFKGPQPVGPIGPPNCPVGPIGPFGHQGGPTGPHGGENAETSIHSSEFDVFLPYEVDPSPLKVRLTALIMPYWFRDGKTCRIVVNTVTGFESPQTICNYNGKNFRFLGKENALENGASYSSRIEWYENLTEKEEILSLPQSLCHSASTMLIHDITRSHGVIFPADIYESNKNDPNWALFLEDVRHHYAVSVVMNT